MSIYCNNFYQVDDDGRLAKTFLKNGDNLLETLKGHTLQ